MSLEAHGVCTGTRCAGAASLRSLASSTSGDSEASSLALASNAASPALSDSGGAQSVLELATGGATDPALSALEGAWPNVALAARLLDALHGATGLPWWATLSLTAAGVHAAPRASTCAQHVAVARAAKHTLLLTCTAELCRCACWGVKSVRGQSEAAAGVRVALLPLTVSTTRAASRLLPLWHLARLRTQGPAGTAEAPGQGGALKLVQTASVFEQLRARERAPSVNRYLGCQVVQVCTAPPVQHSSSTPC